MKWHFIKGSLVNLLLGAISVPAFFIIAHRFLSSFFRTTRMENVIGYLILLAYGFIVFIINRRFYMQAKEVHILKYFASATFSFIIPWIIAGIWYYNYVNYMDGVLKVDSADVNGMFSREQMNFIKTGKNLYDDSKRTDGGVITNKGAWVETAGYSASDYTPVIGGKTYFLNKCRKFVFFNKYKNFVSYQDGTGDSYVFTAPQDGYVRFSFSTKDSNITQFEEGNIGTAYEPFKLIVPNLELEQPKTDRNADRVACDTVTDLANLRQTISFPENVGLISIRFDDNCKTVYQNAYPLLKERGLTATLAWVADKVGALKELAKVTDAETIEMCKDGFELACHSYNHNETPMSTDEINIEVIEAKNVLERDYNFCVKNYVQPGSWTTTNDEVFKHSDVADAIMNNYVSYQGYMTATTLTRPIYERFGICHVSGDFADMNVLKSKVDGVCGVPKSVIFLFHFVGEADRGRTIVEFEEFLDYIVSKRNAGLVDVVTNTGLIAASVGETKNHVFNGNFDSVTNQIPNGWEPTGTPIVLQSDGPDGTHNAVQCENLSFLTQRVQTYGLKSPVYRISFWHKTNSDGKARVIAAMSSGSKSFTAISTSEWQKCEAVFQLAKSDVQFSVIIQPTSGTVIYSDIKVTCIG